MPSSYPMANLCFLVVLLLLHACSLLQLAVSHSVVKFLPGFEGPLPFELETGYVGVGDSEDVQLFYYFVKSERNPKEDPLLVWFTGGPGCSTLTALLFEIGPLYINMVEYNGTLPTLFLNPYSWTKVSNIIFVDSPVGTGFSYATNPLAAQTSDSTQINQAHQFLRKWLMDHPEFLSNPVYIGGDSYSGIIVPVLTHEISTGNEEGMKPLINLQGYVVGNPVTVPSLEGNSQVSFCHRMGLISDELYESLERNCGGEYQTIDPGNVKCWQDLHAYGECISGIQTVQILEPICGFASPKPRETFGRRRSLIEQIQEFLDPDPTLPTIGCRTYGYLLSSYWINDDVVREALRIRKGSIGQWQRCNYGLNYAPEIGNSFQYHLNLSAKGYPALVYSGDHDLIVPYFATHAWVKALNYSIVDDWRPWNVDGQVAGYTRSFSNRMTFATIKGGGHTAPEYRPQECFAMYKRWASQEPL